MFSQQAAATQFHAVYSKSSYAEMAAPGMSFPPGYIEVQVDERPYFGCGGAYHSVHAGSGMSLMSSCGPC